MAGNSEEERRARMEGAFEIICRHKESDIPSNLNKIFESYGTSTLEAKVPIVDDSIAERMTEINDEQKNYATMVFQTQSAHNALEGRLPKTRNRELRTIEVNGEIIIRAGKTRERSPVDVRALDNELDRIQRERKLARSNKSGRTSPDLVENQEDVKFKTEPTNDLRKSINSSKSGSSTRPPFRQKQNKKEVLTQEELDRDLASHMREGERQKRQLIAISEQVDRVQAMEMMDKMIDDDLLNRMEQDGDF